MAKEQPKPVKIAEVGPYDVVKETIPLNDPKVRIMPPIVLGTKK